MFVRGDGVWQQNQKLLATDGDTADTFATTVSIDEDAVVIGAWRSDTLANDAGAAYVYRRGVGGWIEEDKLLLDQAVGSENYGKIEPIVGQAFDRFEYVRMWWPTQDYYNLTWERIKNAITNPAMRVPSSL